MAYIALYRKYRPQTFTDVVGQHQVSDTLMRAIREDKVAHAYLFAGPRGTGKTSLAKIFARAINCEHGPTDHPCNECSPCQSILNGQSMDVLEIDAASNRGIDEVRALRESVKFMPVEGRKKVFIIDEAHMLTTEAWNALLKTIEEPPPHVMFIFATTEIEKLPVTIVSRCQRYTFRRITADDIAQRLLYVAGQEGFGLDTAAAQLIAVHADGGLRDALSILDQCAGMATGDITPQVVEELIGLVSKEWIIHFLDALQQGDGPKVLSYIQEALREGRDATQIMEALIQHVRALLVGKVAPDADELKVYDAFKAEFLQQANQIEFTELNQYIRSAQSIMNDAKQVDNPRTIIEMGLLVLCAKLGSVDDDLEDRVHALELAERSERDELLNRMAQLEQRGPAMVAGAAMVAPTTYGTNGSLPGNYANRFVSIESPAASGHTPQGDEVMAHVNGVDTMAMNGAQHVAPVIGMTPAPGVGMTPPPNGVGMTPPPSGVGMTPPPSGGAQQQAPQRGPQQLRGKSGISTKAIISDTILSANEYRNIQANVIKYLKDSNRQMTSTVIGQGQLVYVDKEKAVVAFKNALHLNLMSNEVNLAEVVDAFNYTLGYSVRVEIVDASTQVYKEYKQASGSTKQQQPKGPARPREQRAQTGHSNTQVVTPNVASGDTLGTKPDVSNRHIPVDKLDATTSDTQLAKPDPAAVNAAKAAALAFLAKQSGTVASDDMPVSSSDDVPVSSFGDVPVSSFGDVPVEGSVPIDDIDENYVPSLDEVPPHPLDRITVISDDGEVLERPMDSGAHIEVEPVPKSDGLSPPYESPIEVEPIADVPIAREYAWDKDHMTEEERNNPLLVETLEKLSEDHHIIVEVIEE